MGATPLLSTTDGRMSVLRVAGSKTKTQINPLERMEGDALAAILPPWSYKS